MEDSKLIELAKGGDVAAYEVLVRAHQRVAFRAAYLILRDPDEAQDALQEGFVRAYRALGRFRQGSPFGPWILTIVTNEAKNRRKAAGRRAGLVLRAAEEASRADASPSSPEAALVATERRAELLGAIEGLPEDDRAVIGYRYFLDLSEAETAEILGCARGTVKSRLSRALGRLREAMREEEENAG